MSFGFSVGDIITVVNLTRRVIENVRNAPAEFRNLEADLNLTQTILTELHSNWHDYSQRATQNGINLGHDQTLRTAFSSVRNGLDELQTELRRRNVRPGLRASWDNMRFSHRLESLQRRLQFHMSSLQLVMQSLTILQGNRVVESLQTVREAQLEQRREDERDEEMRGRQGQEEQDFEEALSTYSSRYRSSRYRHGGRSEERETLNRTTARDQLIERWRQEILTASSIGSPTIPIIQPARPDRNTDAYPHVEQWRQEVRPAPEMMSSLNIPVVQPVRLDYDRNVSTASPTLASVGPTKRSWRAGHAKTSRRKAESSSWSSLGKLCLISGLLLIACAGISGTAMIASAVRIQEDALNNLPPDEGGLALVRFLLEFLNVTGR